MVTQRHFARADSDCTPGYVASLEIMQLPVIAVAGVFSEVKPHYALPATVRGDVWVESIRLSGSRHEVEAAQLVLQQAIRCADVTIG
jgi:hypothetical protein